MISALRRLFRWRPAPAAAPVRTVVGFDPALLGMVHGRPVRQAVCIICGDLIEWPFFTCDTCDTQVPSVYTLEGRDVVCARVAERTGMRGLSWGEVWAYVDARRAAVETHTS